MNSSDFNSPKRPQGWDRWKTPLPGILLFVLVGIAFAPALKNGFITTYDDPDYVTANFHVQQGLTWQNLHWAFTSTTTANWHPLTWLSHMIDCGLFSLQPWGHHLVNVLFHAANTVLVFWFLVRVTGAPWRSFFVAALFGMHPLHVESVAWISERKDVLSVFFGLLALLSYARYVRFNVQRSTFNVESAVATRHQPSTINYSLALFFFACSLMCKPMLVTLPFVMLLLDFWPFERVQQGQDSRFKVQNVVLEKWPFFLLSAVSCTITFLAQKSGGAVVAVGRLPFRDRLENAVVSYSRYLAKLFYPHNLAAFYPLPELWKWTVIGPAVLLLVGISFLVIRFRTCRFLPVGWFWFVGTLVPVIGLVQVGAQAMADRYSYFPSIGFFIIIAWGGWSLLKDRNHARATAAVVLIAIVAVCVPLTWRQIRYWSDGETLFRHAFAVTDDNEMTRYQLGLALDASGKFDEGIRQFERAIQLSSGDARIYNNLGFALEHVGRSDEAIDRYRRALQLDPDYVAAYINLGVALNRAAKSAEATALLEKALQLKPDSPDAHYNLGNIYVRNGRLDDGIAQFQETIRLNPGDADAHNNLGVALSLTNRLDDAIVQFREALKAQPNNAEIHNNVGTIFYRKGFWDEAIMEYQAALKLDANNVEARKNLAMAMRKKSGLLQKPPNLVTNGVP